MTYTHSSGAGGMNVNSTNTKVDLRFHVATATWLSDEIKQKLLIQVNIIQSFQTHNQQYHKNFYI